MSLKVKKKAVRFGNVSIINNWSLITAEYYLWLKNTYDKNYPSECELYSLY